MPKPLWRLAVYTSAFIVAIDLMVELPAGVFAAAFATLVLFAYDRFVWRGGGDPLAIVQAFEKAGWHPPILDGSRRQKLAAELAALNSLTDAELAT